MSKNVKVLNVLIVVEIHRNLFDILIEEPGFGWKVSLLVAGGIVGDDIVCIVILLESRYVRGREYHKIK